MTAPGVPPGPAGAVGAAGAPGPAVAPDDDVSYGDPPSPDDGTWDALADELTPARALARVDAAAARVVDQIALVGVALTAAGLVATATVLDDPVSQGFAVAAVVLALLAVVVALLCQVLTSSRLNTVNREELRSWYRRRVVVRGVLLRWASLAVVAAVVCAGVAAVVAMVSTTVDRPHVTVAREVGAAADDGSVPVTVTVTVAVPATDPGTTTTTTVALADGGAVLASAAEVAGSDGTAEQEVTAVVAPEQAVVVDVTAGTWRCHGEVGPAGGAGTLTCTTP